MYNDQYKHKKDDFKFWNKEIENIISDNIHILELGAGTGRIAKNILLSHQNISYYGIDLSSEFVNEANIMLEKENLSSNAKILHGDMSSFSLPVKFDMIFIPFNSFLHLTDIQSIIQCMACIKNHLLDSGYVYLDIFVPNPLLLYRPVDIKAHVMNYHNSLGEKIVIEEQLDYNKADNTADIVWDFINKNTNQIQTFNFQIMIHFPDTIMNLIQDNGFCIDAVYGGYDKRPLNEDSILQIYKFSQNIV